MEMENNVEYGNDLMEVCELSEESGNKSPALVAGLAAVGGALVTVGVIKLVKFLKKRKESVSVKTVDGEYVEVEEE